MNRTLAFFFVGSLSAIPLTWAGELTDVKLSLHVQPIPVSKKAPAVCDPAALAGISCSQHTVSGMTETPYHVYLVVARGDPGSGIGGVSVGVDYDATVTMQGWIQCSNLGLPSNEGGKPYWPKSGGATRLTWSPTNCQRNTVPGHEEEGVHAVGGAFYVYAYAPGGDLSLTPNLVEEPSDLLVADCSAKQAALNPDDLPLVRFSATGTEPGVSPCALDPVPTRPTSWGRIKHGYE